MTLISEVLQTPFFGSIPVMTLFVKGAEAVVTTNIVIAILPAASTADILRPFYSTFYWKDGEFWQ